MMIITGLLELGIIIFVILFVGYWLYKIFLMPFAHPKKKYISEDKSSKYNSYGELTDTSVHSPYVPHVTDKSYKNSKSTIDEKKYGHCSSPGCTCVGELHWNGQCESCYYDDNDDD